jgi:hypothetical protein
MNITIKRIIFYSFCLIFLIATPIIILYSSGYEIDWRHLFTPLAVQKTGMVIIYSEPTGAEIYLNDQKQYIFSSLTLKFIPAKFDTIKTPARIKNLLPGAYDLQVELPGYWPWNRRINIYPGKITHILDINLFKQGSPVFIAATADKQLYLSPSDKKIFLPQSGKIFDLKTEIFEKISSGGQPPILAEWSRDGGKIISGKNLLNLKNPAKNLALNKIIGTDITNLKLGETGLVYYQHRDSLNRFNPDNNNNETLLQENKILDYEARGKNLYYITESGLSAQLKIYSLNDKKNLKTLDLPFSDGYRLINPSSKLINLYDEKYKILYLVDPSPSAKNPLVETINSVEKTEWSSDNELIWANDFEIWMLDLARSEKRLITRWSAPIKSILKTKTANYIIFATEKNINAITWTQTGEISVTELASMDTISSPIISDGEKNLYFTAKQNGEEGLYKLNIQ